MDRNPNFRRCMASLYIYVALLTWTEHDILNVFDLWPQIDEALLFISWKNKNKLRVMTWPWDTFLRWCRRWPSTIYAERNNDMTTGSLICRIFSVIYKRLMVALTHYQYYIMYNDEKLYINFKLEYIFGIPVEFSTNTNQIQINREIIP